MNRRKLSDDKIYPSESYISYCSLQSAKVSDRENNDERLLQAPSISVSLATRGSDAKQEREELGLLIQKLTADMGRVVEENKEMKKKLENLEQEKQENELLVSWLSAGHGRQSSLGRASVQDAIVYRDVPTTAPGQEGKGAQPLTTQKSRSFFGVKLTSNSAPRKEEKRPTRDKQRRKLASRDRARSPDDGLDTKSVDAIPTFKFGSTFERTLRKLQRKFSNMKAKFDNFRRLKPRLVELLKEKDKLEQENSSLIRQQIEISAQVTELRNARDELQFANEKLVEENKRLVCQFVSAPSSTEDGGSERSSGHTVSKTFHRAHSLAITTTRPGVSEKAMKTVMETGRRLAEQRRQSLSCNTNRMKSTRSSKNSTNF
ncbi:uncharacterized protein [Ptychodera flava]|uniref:uncharacterized protein n=1 Tax=Ptychodera flava TaxID=63121 RepID=UPI00396A7FCC